MNECTSLNHIAHLTRKPYVVEDTQIPEYQEGYVYIILTKTSSYHHEMGGGWSSTSVTLGFVDKGWYQAETHYVVFIRPEDAFAYKLENNIVGEVFPMKLMTIHPETKKDTK